MRADRGQRRQHRRHACAARGLRGRGHGDQSGEPRHVGRAQRRDPSRPWHVCCVSRCRRLVVSREAVTTGRTHAWSSGDRVLLHHGPGRRRRWPAAQPVALSRREYGNPRNAFRAECGYRRRWLGRDGAQGAPGPRRTIRRKPARFRRPRLVDAPRGRVGLRLYRRDAGGHSSPRTERKPQPRFDAGGRAALAAQEPRVAPAGAARSLLGQLPCRRLYRLCQTRVPGGPARPRLRRHAARPDAVPSGPRTAVPRVAARLPAEKAGLSMRPLDTLVLGSLANGVGVALLVGAICAVALVLKSMLDFTRTGPEMADEVLRHYRLYLAYSLARLVVFTLLITA